MLPSPCMLPSMCSAPSAKLPPLYAPVSPVARAPRFKPCPVALVPTLGCSRPPTRNFYLLRSSLSGRIIPAYIYLFQRQNGPYISRKSPFIPQEKKHRLTQTISLVPGRALARAAGERRILLVCIHAHVPTARSRAETAQGGAPANPTLIESDKKSTYNNADNNIDIQQVSVL